jgi:hypothetical protein
VRFAAVVRDDRRAVNGATGRPYRFVLVELPGSGLAFAVSAPPGAEPFAAGSFVAVEGRVVVTYAGGPSGLVMDASAPAGTYARQSLVAPLLRDERAAAHPSTEIAHAVVAAYPSRHGVLAVCHGADDVWEFRRYPHGASEPDFTLPVLGIPYHSTADQDRIAGYGKGVLTVVEPDGPVYATMFPPEKDCQVAVGHGVTWVLLRHDQPARPVYLWTLHRIVTDTAVRAASTVLPNIAESWELPVVSPAGATPVPMSMLARLDFAGGRAFAALPHLMPDGRHAQYRVYVGRTGPPEVELVGDGWTLARVDTLAGPVEHTTAGVTLAGQSFPPAPGVALGRWRPLTPTLTAGVVSTTDGQVVHLLQTVPGTQPVLHRHHVGTGFVSVAADASEPDAGAWFVVDQFSRSEVYVHDLRTGQAGRYDVDGSLRLVAGDARAGEITAIRVDPGLDPVLNLMNGVVGAFDVVEGSTAALALGRLVRIKIGEPR